MDLALENLSKEQLIGFIQKKDVLLEKKDVLIEKKDADLKKLDVLIEKKESTISYLQFQLDQMRRLLFGSKRERFIAATNPEQLMLPLEGEPEKIAEVLTQKIEYSRNKNKRENHPGRLPLPSHLPVEEIVIEPKENTEGLTCIGKEITDELELVPAKLFIRRYIRPKYSNLNAEGVLIAELPSRPIEKCIAGPGLLSQILIDKYVDHLPIYRQIKRFEREGVKIPSSTIDSWQRLCSNLLDPLYECLKYHVLTEGYLQVDETPTPVLDKTKEGKTHRGFHWVYHAPMQKAVFFDYQKGRGSDGPRALLKDFKGYLQVDGYGVYEWFGKQPGITLVSCMAHARRMFEKALDDNKVLAQHVLTQMQLLYSIERTAREENHTPEQRHSLRLDQALPVLNNLGKWMAEKSKTVLPQSPMSKAFHYTMSRWDSLLAYLHDGNLEIDNNLVENAIRPNALGRKNYLFAGSHNGAERIAMFYSFFGTCKKNNVNPFTWLKYVLENLPDYPANRMKELLPQFIKF